MRIRTIAIASVSLLTFVSPAFAQDKPAADDAATKDADKEIVVTGTSIRGVAPAGAENFAVTAEAIKATGATSTQSLLATIPQMSSFNSIPYAGVGGARLTVNRINLRNLPQGTGGGSPTLTLINGHRFVGSGIQQASPDPSIIPPGLVDHVEVVLGGGSAVYGADAIGGVLNFIMKKDVDGFQISGTHGFGDKYHSNNIDFLAGKKWDTGSVYVAYSYAHNTNIRTADRAFERSGSYASGTFAPVGLQCNAGNLQTVTSTGAVVATYAVTGPTTFTAGTANLCDTTKYNDLFPAERRHSVMGGFRQELGNSVEVGVTGYYSTRVDLINTAGPLGFTVNKKTTDAGGYVPVTTGDTSDQKVSGTFVATAGAYNPTTTKLTSYGFTPSLTWNIDSNWTFKAFYNMGESKTTVHEPAVNTTALQAAATAGTFNPYNPGASSNATALGTALNWENYGIGISHLDNIRAVVDGSVFHLPGGDVKIAVGGEYIKEVYRGINNVSGSTQATVNATTNPLSRYARNEKSVFGEINIPIVGPDNAMAGIYSFSLQAAERYDSYSDFGNTWSPSLGASFKPVEWINFRGNWNKSFQAPSPADLAFTTTVATYRAPFIYSLAAPLVNPAPDTNLGTLVGGGRTGGTTANGFIGVTGTNPGLKPQRSDNLTLGLDVSPPVVPGLTLKGSYFKISYFGQIGIPPHGSSFAYWANYPSLYAMNPTYAQVVTALTNAGVSATSQAAALTAAGCSSTSCNLYYVSIDLGQNLGNVKASGLDLGFDYRHETGFGSVYASFNGTYLLNFQVSPSATAAYTANGVGSDLALQPSQRFSFTTSLGANAGGFRGQITWKHQDGYNLTTAVGLGQTRVGAYNVFDLFTSYDVKQGGLPPFTLSLGITNLFDKNPPNYNSGGGNTAGFANGNTLGRVVSLGASVKF